MKKIIIAIGVIVGIVGMFIAYSANAQNKNEGSRMKMNAGIVTSKINESKAFYTNILNFGVTFENEFYLLMHTPDGKFEIGFLLPMHPSQQPVFQLPFQGKGIFLTLEVDNVDKEYERITALKIPIEIELRDEPWGDRHFALVDPNGVGIDIVTYSAPDQKN